MNSPRGLSGLTSSVRRRAWPRPVNTGLRVCSTFTNEKDGRQRRIAYESARRGVADSSATAAVSAASADAALLQVGVGEIPVDHVPPGLYVLRACVAVVDIVGVLPHVAGQDRLDTMGDRRVGVLGRDDVQRAVGLLHQPGPSAAKMSGRRFGEFFLEGGKIAKGLFNPVGHLPCRITAAVRLQRGPVEAVVEVLGR